MEEIITTILDKDDLRNLRELKNKRQHLELLSAEFIAGEVAFWVYLRRKYKLDERLHHYIKNNKICTKVL